MENKGKLILTENKNTQGRKTISLLHGIFCQRRHVKNKQLIYESVTKIIMQDGFLEIWPVTRRAERKLLETEWDFWKKQIEFVRDQYVFRNYHVYTINTLESGKLKIETRNTTTIGK